MNVEGDRPSARLRKEPICQHRVLIKCIINDACVREGKPFSHCGVLGWQGQTLTVIPHKTACYRCIFEGVPPHKSVPHTSDIGIFGPVPGILGTIQAAECIKFLIGLKTLLANTLLTFDAKTMLFRRVPFHKNKNCTACGTTNSR